MKTDFRLLYEENAEYVQRRDPESYETRRTLIEVRRFKVPNLMAVVPASTESKVIVEIGCATGELLAEFVARQMPGCRGIGFDLSPSNIHAARNRYPALEFRDDDFVRSGVSADVVILSDVLEHVPDDVGFLRAASSLARLTLINLPLEDNWLNSRRNYGPSDVSGHLRRYTLQQGFDLVVRSGLHLVDWRQVWLHETECETDRAQLRRQVSGFPYGGGRLTSSVKAAVVAAARQVRPFGRRLFSSNLFACAVLDETRRASA